MEEEQSGARPASRGGGGPRRGARPPAGGVLPALLALSVFVFFAVFTVFPPDAYSNTRLPHLTVYHKLAMRHGEVPSVKERVSYVIIAPTPEAERDARAVRPGLAPGKLLVSDLAEDPAYVVAHGVPLNTEYYFSHLLSTLSVTFKALFGNDTKITERLLKRFIPETAPGDAPFEHEAFAPLTGEGGESLQTLRTIFCTPTAAPRRS